MYTPPCVKQASSGRPLYRRGAQLGVRDDRDGWMGEGGRLRREGGYVYLQPILVVVRQRPATL